MRRLDLFRDRWSRLGEILEAAETLDELGRSELIERESGGDGEVRRELVALFQADARAPAYLEQGAIALAAPSWGGDETPAADEPAPIAGYRLFEEIGRGGMSRVFAAERVDDPLRRRFAIKRFAGGGFLRDDLRRRFVAEGRALAALSHPNIARIFDSGVDDQGLPYLAMERIDGLQITEHCAAGALDLVPRIDLFLDVCSAVSHAHQRLIVHRDLKPSNILVDREGVVKLLDFGIAKLLAPPEADLDELPAATRTGLLPMTPEYAAPEQVRGEEITTATDVYALGLLLFELLTGRRAQILERRSAGELEHVICSLPAPRPSNAVAFTEAVVAGGTSSLRPRKSSRIRRRLAGDIDTIVLKALRKEPGQRYPSVEALAQDLVRQRSGLPVAARPASLGYRARKFVGRHRAGVAAAVTAALAVLAFGSIALLQRAEAVRQRDAARFESAKASEVQHFLLGLFEASDPAESRGEEITARELLARGRARADLLGGTPLVRAQMLAVIGAVYRALGNYDLSDQLFRDALEIRRAELPPGDPLLAETRSQLAGVLVARGEYDEAAALYDLALAGFERSVGAEDRRTLAVRNDQAQLARIRGDHVLAATLFAAVLADKEHLLGELDESVAATLSDFADLQIDRGEGVRAEELLRRASSILDAALGEEHPKSLVVRQRLARASLERGDYPTAERLGREIIAIQRRVLGADHPEIATTLNSTLAPVQYFRKDFAGAEATYREIVRIRAAALGEEHPDVAIAMGNLSMMLVEQGRVDEGEALARRTLELKRRIHEPGHPSIASSLHTLAVILQRQGEPSEAERLLREALDIRLVQLGPRAPRVASIRHELALVAAAQGRFAEAEALLREALAIRRESQEATHPHIRADLEALAEIHERSGDPVRALAVRAEIEALFPREPPP